jgi:hypothetical protein
MAKWYQCRKTGKFIPADEYHASQSGNQTHFVQPDVEDYISPVTGLWVSGRKQRQADLRNTGSRPWEGIEQEQKEAARQRQYQEQKAERDIYRAAESAIMQLPENLRRQLAG